MNFTISSPGAFFGAVILVGFVFAIACGSVARARGHDRTTWMILGFFLGFIALIVVAVLPEGEIGRKRCPDCASTVLEQAKVCKHCSYRFAPTA